MNLKGVLNVLIFWALFIFLFCWFVEAKICSHWSQKVMSNHEMDQQCIISTRQRPQTNNLWRINNFGVYFGASRVQQRSARAATRAGEERERGRARRKAPDSREIIRKSSGTDLDLSSDLPSFPAPVCSSQEGKAALLHRTENDLAVHPGTFALWDYFPSTMITLTPHYYTQHTQRTPLHHVLPKRNNKYFVSMHQI